MELIYKGTPFAITDEGKGSVVILLHGFLENKSMWIEMSTYLSKKNRIITLDLLGHGSTGCIGYVHTMEQMADQVKTVVDHLGVRKVTLVGHSMGGYVALAFAELYPEYIKGLCLFYSTARADTYAKKADRERAVKLVKQDPKSFVRISIPNLFRPKSRELFRDRITEVKNEALKTPTQGIVAALEGMKIRTDREVILHFAAFPISIISGKKDPVLPIKIMEEQMKGRSVTHTLITPDGHMGHIENFKEVTQGLQFFLKSL